MSKYNAPQSLIYLFHNRVGSPLDESLPKIGTILPRFHQAKSRAELAQIIYEEFVSWFGEFGSGAVENYKPMATDLWSMRELL